MGRSTFASSSSSNPPAGVYSRDRIYSSPIVERSSYVFKNIHFNNFTCATFLRRDISHLVPSTYLDASTEHHSSAFVIRPAGHKGLGAFTRRATAPGSILLSEHPLLVVARTCGDVSTLLGNLEMEKFLGLANSKRYEYDRETEGIMQTNAIEIELPTEEGTMGHHAVFLDFSRVNHSCSPNAQWKWDAKTFMLTLEAVRPIAKGEEITVQYIDSCVDYRQRRDKLASLYGFDCLCPTCSQPDHERSNKARRELRNIMRRLPKFESWCSSRDMPDDYLINLSERALQLRESEGLQLFESRKHTDDMAMCYAALEDTDMFKLHAQKGMEHRTGGPLEHRLVLECWLEQPTHFPVWGMRKRATKKIV
ncbi:SET domain-containing protein [Hymenopellis radicata]|nr:SET domain-containing protein [Hymenopellis radicata]